MTLARAFNRALDRGDDLTADLIAEYAQAPCREQDAVFASLPTAEAVEAALDALLFNQRIGDF